MQTTMRTNDPALLDIQQVADLMGCSVRHVFRLAKAFRMPAAVKLGRLSKWPRVTIEAWIADGCPVPNSAAGRGSGTTLGRLTGVLSQ